VPEEKIDEIWNYTAENNARLVQEPGWFLHKPCIMRDIAPFLSGCCSETEVSEQLYYFSIL
jgi:hypothetical protein